MQIKPFEDDANDGDFVPDEFVGKPDKFHDAVTIGMIFNIRRNKVRFGFNLLCTPIFQTFE